MALVKEISRHEWVMYTFYKLKVDGTVGVNGGDGGLDVVVFSLTRWGWRRNYQV